MARDDRGDWKSPFALQFRERDAQYYADTPEFRQAVKEFDAVVAAVERPPGTATDAFVLSPHRAMYAFFDTITSKGDLLGFAGRLLADWVQGKQGRKWRLPDRRERAVLLTTLVRAPLADQRGAPVTERQVGQMAAVVAAAIPFLEPAELAVLAEWAADMAQGIPDVFPAQPTAVIRGVLFSPHVVKSVDVPRAVVFWDKAVAEPQFPWRIFSDPCRPGRGIILTEFHRNTVSKILSLASETAVRRITAQMREHAVAKRVEFSGRDALGGEQAGDIVVPAGEAECRELLHTITLGVNDTFHKGRRSLVADLFSEQSPAAG